MVIHCTKKLLDFLEIAPQPSEVAEPLFSFSANLLVLNRRKCVVVVNEATGCGFLLYGITAKDKKRIQEKLEEALYGQIDYFVDLIPEIQDEIIRRNEHDSVG